MDRETEEVGCRCPPEIRAVTRNQRINCESLFRFSYEYAGDNGQFGKAVFMKFVSLPEDAKPHKIPMVVRDFMQRVGVTHRGICSSSEKPCSACTLSRIGIDAQAKLSELEFPEVTQKTVFEEASLRRTPYQPIKAGEEFTIKDQYWLALLESGAPDAEEETWDQLVLHEDESS